MALLFSTSSAYLRIGEILSQLGQMISEKLILGQQSRLLFMQLSDIFLFLLLFKQGSPPQATGKKWLRCFQRATQTSTLVRRARPFGGSFNASAWDLFLDMVTDLFFQWCANFQAVRQTLTHGNQLWDPHKHGHRRRRVHFTFTHLGGVGHPYCMYPDKSQKDSRRPTTSTPKKNITKHSSD